MVVDEIKDLVFNDYIEELVYETPQKEDETIARVIKEELGELSYTDVEGTSKVKEDNWYKMLEELRVKGEI